jgi:3-hydroxybutyryl-CoA dehydrogenase
LKTTPLHHAMANARWFGRKSGKGFHDYGSNTRAASGEEPQPLVLEPFLARLPERSTALASLAAQGLQPNGGDRTPLLIEPFGEDATTVAHRLSADPASVVAIDLSGIDRQFVTIMAPPGPCWALPLTRDWLSRCGFQVNVIADTPGFVAQRILAMIANLGCEMAQIGLATPSDIDKAMELGLNYPRGPLALVDHIGASIVHRTLCNLQAITGSDRYRPSLWLRRRALLNMSALVAG